ncbi:MAG: dTDP-4-dehydrorhamnose reductase, partial [Chloroflexota bacterium]|nr:dTDP-4-dehydrorhamnose reductase [Chloroflexota bacterium]
MRILITGGKGQLAGDLVRTFEPREVRAVGRDELDIAAPEQIEAIFEDFRPEVVVNTAAYHQVDRCESEPEQSFAVNAAAPQRLAAACERRGALLVHLSTDYVFSGEASAPYRETDPIGPINVYGASKAAGEMVIRATGDQHLIIRTTGLYGLAGRRTSRGNFVETMLRLAETGAPISVVSDQCLTPSLTKDVAAAIVRLVDRGATGTFHVTNDGACSWFEFAAEIFRLAEVTADLSAVRQADRPAPAKRPAYS